MNSKKPLILISNDDGYHSNGIRTLVSFLSDFADIVVCAFEDPAYFSHRRACAAGGKAGRFAGIAEATRDTPA